MPPCITKSGVRLVAVVCALVSCQQLIHAAAIGQGVQISCPLAVGGAAVLQPQTFLLRDCVLKISTVAVDGVQLFAGEHAVDGVGSGVIHKGHPIVLKVGKTLDGAVLHVEILIVVLAEDQLGTPDLVGRLQLTGTLVVLCLGLLLGDGLPLAVGVLLGEEHANGAVLQLHHGLAVIPLVKELQQVGRALALVGHIQVAAVGTAAGTYGDVVGAVRAVQHGQEHIVLGVIAHQFLDVPPGGNAQIALCALSQQLVGILTEHLHVHQTLGVPVVEVGDRLAVVVLGADKAALAVLLQHQIVAHIVGPVGESEACVEDVLTPAPLVKAGGHGDGAAGCITVDLGRHIVVLEGLQGGVQLVQRARLTEYAAARPSAEYHEKKNGEHGVWQYKVDLALPCATQNELDLDDAKMLVANGVTSVTEGANMPTTLEATKYLQENGVLFVGGKAANAGGVATSALEMSQNSERLSWTFEEVDGKLKGIMETIYANISDAAKRYNATVGGNADYVAGANIAGFEKVVNAMLAQGVC